MLVKLEAMENNTTTTGGGSHARPSLLISLDQIQTHDWVGKKPNRFNPSMFGGNQELKTIIYSLKLIHLEVSAFDGITTKNCSTYIPEGNFGNSLEFSLFFGTTRQIYPHYFFQGETSTSLSVVAAAAMHVAAWPLWRHQPGRVTKRCFHPKLRKQVNWEFSPSFQIEPLAHLAPSDPMESLINQIQATFFKRCYHKGF